ncbi:aspartyl-phosphate phosphatase Spo0E family protein [Gracilibacillus saliphilus]|uniref:aspartyl-phosphate phosphatase Spo0E family protein n=1 Tax=Gracilibacillus saliphilus TaxID=543890 RepID=UPI001EE24EF5|nr:aspartyl-phosphate phosphatase Spo0E family protein [Gracilibacillus saliphilus]
MDKHNDGMSRALLLARIEAMRSELLKIGNREGLTAPITLKYSQSLDEKIKEYQELMKDT